MRYLLDTDVLIDWLQGRSWVRELLLSRSDRFYCSAITRKELLSKPGLSATERERIVRLLRVVRVLSVDSVIAAAASELLQKYADQPLRVHDALIAATAWTKNLPLLTRNRKHYQYIEEIVLVELPPEVTS